MKKCYTKKNFSNATETIIRLANDIIAEYQADGYRLTLRQIYYQFVARDLIENTQRSYKRLGGIINDGRLAGLIDWTAIEDRGRNLQKLATWNDPAEIVSACAEQFRLDLWEGQTYRPEVWIEKEALIGVVERACTRSRVPYFACKGYVSQSEMWSAGHRRFLAHIRGHQIPRILHFGDHDPSGMDMTRDIRDRLKIFLGTQHFELVRLALNFDQIEEYQPPPNPAKVTDSRFEAYRAEYGDESWELDALEPAILEELITTEIESLIDREPWGTLRDSEAEHKKALTLVARDWGVAADFVASLDGADDEWA